MALANPCQGSTAAVTALKSCLVTQSEAFVSVRQLLSSDRQGRVSVWTGAAADAWDVQVGALESSFSTIQLAYDSVSSAVSTYVLELERIQGEYSALVGKSQYLEQHWPNKKKYDDDAAGRARFYADLQSASNKRFSYEAYSRALVEQRLAADSRFVGAVSGAMPQSWFAVYQSLRAAGIKDLSKLTDAELGAALAGYASKAIKDDDLSEEELLVLQSLLDAYWDDPEVAGAMFDGLGPEGTNILLDILGRNLVRNPVSDVYNLDGVREVPPAEYELAIRLRDAFAVGSGRILNPEVFAAGLFALSESRNLGAISFLFNGPIPVSAGMTLLVANEVNALEQQFGSRLGGNSYLNSFESYLDTGHWVLEVPAQDLADRVFNTLGQYPMESAAFLAPGGEPDETRIDYWFRQREWETFEGPGALWLGTQLIPGGPVVGPYDAGSSTLAAELAFLVIEGLYKNPSFDTSHVSEIGAAKLAGALGAQMPGFLEHPLFSESGRTGPFMDVDYGGLMDTRVFANLDQDALAKIMGVAGSHSAGADILTAATIKNQDALLNLVRNADDPSVAAVLERVAILQGALDGAVSGTKLGDAAARDKAVAKVVDAITLVVGAAPVPGGLLGSLGFSALLDASTSYLGDSGGYESREQKAQDEASELRTDGVQLSLALLAWDLLPAAVKVGVPDPTCLVDQNAWYKENKAALDHLLDPRSGGFTTGSMGERYRNAYGDYAGKTRY